MNLIPNERQKERVPCSLLSIHVLFFYFKMVSLLSPTSKLGYGLCVITKRVMIVEYSKTYISRLKSASQNEVPYFEITHEFSNLHSFNRNQQCLLENREIFSLGHRRKNCHSSISKIIFDLLV